MTTETLRPLADLIEAQRVLEYRRANALQARKIDRDLLDYLDGELEDVAAHLTAYEAADEAEEPEDIANLTLAALLAGTAELHRGCPV